MPLGCPSCLARIPLVRRPADRGEEHLELARRQAVRQLARSLRDAVPGGREHRVDRLPVESSLLCLAQELNLRRRGVERRPVGRASRMAV